MPFNPIQWAADFFQSAQDILDLSFTLSALEDVHMSDEEIIEIAAFGAQSLNENGVPDNNHRLPGSGKKVY